MKNPRLILLDDDPLFSRTLKGEAARRGVSLTCCSDLKELERHLGDGPWDGAIVDYYLGEKLGLEAARILGERVPILLTSTSGRWLRDTEFWPGTIEKFIHKKWGAKSILDTALTVLERRPHAEMVDAPNRRQHPFF